MPPASSSVRDLDASAPYGRVTGEADVATGDRGESRVRITASDLRAARVMQAFAIDTVAATTVGASVEASWPQLQVERATGNAAITLTPDREAAGAGAVAVGGRVDVEARDGDVVADIARLSAAGAGLRGQVRLTDRERLGGQVNLEVPDTAETIARVESLLGRPRGSLLPAPIEGAVNGTVRLEGTTDAPVAHATIAAPSLTAGNAEAMSLDARATYTTDAVNLEALNLQWQEATLRAEGRVGLDDAQRLDVTFSAQGLDVASMLDAAGQSSVPASGTLAADGDVRGTTTRPTGSVTLRVDGLQAYGETWGTLASEVALEGRQVRLADLTLQKPQPDGDGRLHATGAYDLDRGTFTLDLDSSNLRLVGLTPPGGEPVRAALDLQGRVNGTLDEPEGRVTIAAADVQRGEQSFGDMRVEADLAGGSATIRAAVPKFATSVDGTVGVQAPYPVSAAARVDGLSLEALPVELDTPLTGTITARAHADGPLGTPADLTATVQLDRADGTWNGQPFALDAPATVAYKADRVTVENLRVSARDSSVEVSGEWPLDGEGQDGALSIRAEANLESLAAYAPAGTEVTGDGTLTLDGMVRGTLDAIDPDPRLQPSRTRRSRRPTSGEGSPRPRERCASATAWPTSSR
ncbi:MAG: hypothetical protein R2712_19445 [Vicinamibacterales bacterium]